MQGALLEALIALPLAAGGGGGSFEKGLVIVAVIALGAIGYWGITRRRRKK
jgi:hypothetical protein